MIKRLALLVLLPILALCLGMLAAQFSYRPELPFQSKDKSEVASILEHSDGSIVKITTEDKTDWYGAKALNGQAIRKVKEEMEKRGWEFQQQEGSGYFFTRGREKVIITSEMWSSKYVLFRIPKDLL